MGKMGGAPACNQNARKHGFYSKILTETEKLEMEEAKKIEGLEDEIAMLRVKLCSLFGNQPDRTDLQLKALGMISRLVKTNHAVIPADRKRYKNALSNILKEVAIPLGLKFLPGKPDYKEESGYNEWNNDDDEDQELSGSNLMDDDGEDECEDLSDTGSTDVVDGDDRWT